MDVRSKMEYHPFAGSEDDRDPELQDPFNTFSGYPISKAFAVQKFEELSVEQRKEWEENWQFYRNHILNQMADRSNHEEGEAVLNWFSWLFQNPSKKPEVSLVLVGSQGIGKDLCFLKFAADILGEESVHKISKMAQYKEKFNGWKEKCRLCVFSDAGDSKSQIDHEMIKADLDGLNHTVIRNMYIQQKMVRCSVAFMFSYNHLGGNVIGSKERRFFATGCFDYEWIDNYVRTHKLHDRSEYFIKMAAINPVTIAYYLYTRDLSKFNIMAMPVTATLVKLKERSLEVLDVVGDFVSHLANNTLHNSVPVDGTDTFSDRKYFTLDAKGMVKSLKKELEKKKDELLVKTKGVPLRDAYRDPFVSVDMMEEINYWRADQKQIKKLSRMLSPMQGELDFANEVPQKTFNSFMRFTDMTPYEFFRRFLTFRDKSLLSRKSWPSYQSPTAHKNAKFLAQAIRTFLGLDNESKYFFGSRPRVKSLTMDDKTKEKRVERIRVPNLENLSKIYLGEMTKQASTIEKAAESVDEDDDWDSLPESVPVPASTF